MKESTPRRIAAGALFTAAVGFSVGAVCAPAQADAFTSHSAFPAAEHAYLPQHQDAGARSFLPISTPMNDRLRGGHDDFNVRPQRGIDRGVRVVDEQRFYDNDEHRGRGDDRDCRPDRIRPYQGAETIAYSVRPVDQVLRVGDERRDRDDRDCRHERDQWGEEGGSGYAIGYDVQRIESSDQYLRIDDRHHADHHGRHHDRRDCRHTPGRDAPRMR